MNYAEGVTQKSAKKPLVIGHRGASGYRPEHTRSAYTLAVEMGADALEPDVVITKDGVLVVRHENEISGTTNVADFPEFADRKTTKMVDGVTYTGWFTEDFTWDELSQLTCRERLPELRPESAAYDDQEPILRLVDLLELIDELADAAGRPITLVLEVKHPTYFASIGLPLAEPIAQLLQENGWADGSKPLTVECFEVGVHGELRERGVNGEYVLLIADRFWPPDLFAAQGQAAPTYNWFVMPEGLDEVQRLGFAAISVDKSRILDDASFIPDAHERGLAVYTWTLRPENEFLDDRFKTNGEPAAWGNYRDEWQLILDAGIDGAFADQPDLLVALLAGD